MSKVVFENMIFPTPTAEVFNKIPTLGWYDGIADGLACFAQYLDLLAWGRGQDKRVFALSQISISVFDDAVGLLSGFEPPVWPRWHPGWHSNGDEGKLLGENSDVILVNEERPDFVIETSSMFETIFAARQLSGPSVELLPDHFDGFPHLDNYDSFHLYLGMKA